MKQELKKHGITQGQLAEQLHVHRDTIGNWIRSETIPLQKLRAICEKTGIPLVALLPSETANYVSDVELAYHKRPKSLTPEEELEMLKNNYIELLEKYLALYETVVYKALREERDDSDTNHSTRLRTYLEDNFRKYDSVFRKLA